MPLPSAAGHTCHTLSNYWFCSFDLMVSLQAITTRLGHPPALWSPGSLQRLVTLPALFASANSAALHIVVSDEEELQAPDGQGDVEDGDTDEDGGDADEDDELAVL